MNECIWLNQIEDDLTELVSEINAVKTIHLAQLKLSLQILSETRISTVTFNQVSGIQNKSEVTSALKNVIDNKQKQIDAEISLLEVLPKIWRL